MDRSSRDRRHYKATPLPTLREEVDVSQNRDLLLGLYDQVCSVWKELVGVRFKLLGLVPTVSLALLATILSGKGQAMAFIGRVNCSSAYLVSSPPLGCLFMTVVIPSCTMI